jgi:hypothetical protein
MATSGKGYHPVIEAGSGMERSPEQAAREAAMLEVEDTLLNIEQAIKRADPRPEGDPHRRGRAEPPAVPRQRDRKA